MVGRRDAKSGTIRLWKMGEGTRPYGIELDAEQRPWFVLFGTNAVGTIDPTTMKDRRFTLPDGARPRRIAVTSTGIWYGTTRGATSAGWTPRVERSPSSRCPGASRRCPTP